MMGLACLFMVACNNAPKQQEQTNEPQEEAVVAEEHHCPFCPLKAEYANWENMEETAKAELNKKAYTLFSEMDAEFAAKNAEIEAEGQKMVEMTEEAKAECEAKCAEMKAECEKMMETWANFDNLSLEEQKDLIMGRLEMMKQHQCKHEGEGHECCHQEGEAHECQHGEGHQCQHGEGHQCQHEAK